MQRKGEIITKSLVLMISTTSNRKTWNQNIKIKLNLSPWCYSRNEGQIRDTIKMKMDGREEVIETKLLDGNEGNHFCRLLWITSLHFFLSWFHLEPLPKARNSGKNPGRVFLHSIMALILGKSRTQGIKRQVKALWQQPQQLFSPGLPYL